MTKQTEALKLALEALEAYRPVIVKRYGLTYSVGDSAITAIREALAEESSSVEQPAQQHEPVAWRVFDKDPFDGRDHRWVYFDKSEFVDGVDPTTHFNLEPVYTSPPAQRKPLTDEQIMAIGKELGLRCRLGGNPSIDFDYARAIEAAHGIYAPAELKDEQCAKCKGLGYYDEGHENDDGTMSGGSYVECDKCKPA